LQKGRKEREGACNGVHDQNKSLEERGQSKRIGDKGKRRVVWW
jgi:hypothetical protein